MRIDANGRVGIGTDSPENKLHLVDTSNPGNTSGSIIIEGRRDGTANLLTLRAKDASAPTLALPNGQGSVLRWQGFDGTDFENMGYILVSADGQAVANGDAPSFMAFGTSGDGSSSPTERMRIDSSGKVLVGKTTDGIAVEGVEFNTASHFTNFTRQRNSAGGTIAQFNRTGSFDGSVMSFMRSGSEVGSISVTSSATAFNTSSDYRLKENVISLSSALDTVSKIKPSTFNFIDTPNQSVDGFIAHELAEVVPYAVSGEKDGIDENGEPIYQGVDHSKLVPLLVGAIQELKAEIEQLKNK